MVFSIAQGPLFARVVLGCLCWPALCFSAKMLFARLDPMTFQLQKSNFTFATMSCTTLHLLRCLALLLFAFYVVVKMNNFWNVLLVSTICSFFMVSIIIPCFGLAQFALPHIIGWNWLINQSHKSAEASPSKVNPQLLDLEWDRWSDENLSRMLLALPPLLPLLDTDLLNTLPYYAFVSSNLYSYFSCHEQLGLCYFLYPLTPTFVHEPDFFRKFIFKLSRVRKEQERSCSISLACH